MFAGMVAGWVWSQRQKRIGVSVIVAVRSPFHLPALVVFRLPVALVIYCGTLPKGATIKIGVVGAVAPASFSSVTAIAAVDGTFTDPGRK